jgi:hypothetical protein
MTIIARIISILLGVIVISKVYLDYKKRNIGLTVFLFWVIAWFGIIVISISPIIIERMSGLIGEGNTGMTAFFAISFVFIFFVVYRVYIKANRLEKMISDIVIKLGLRDLDDKK